MAVSEFVVYAAIRIEAEDAEGAELIVQTALDEAEELMGTTAQVTGSEPAKDEN